MALVTILTSNTDELPDLLIINEPIPLDTLIGLLDRYRYKHLFLPTTHEWSALYESLPKTAPGYRDHRPLYAGYRALNDWFCHPGNPTHPRIQLPPKNEP